MAQLTIKAYLLGKEETTREIRRFAVDLPARYQPIREKVAELFQGLLRNSAAATGAFQMYYKGEQWRDRRAGEGGQRSWVARLHRFPPSPPPSMELSL